MSERIPGAATTPRLDPALQPREAIARAAASTGVDFDFLLAQAQIESGLNPRAEARSSSASGLYQFVDQTWLATLDRHGERLGYGALAQAIDTSGGRARVSDPAMRQAIMDLRFDPVASAMMAGALATDNRAMLVDRLGREPDASELYLAHFLGAGDAATFLDELGSNPAGSAVALLPRAAAANPAIFRHRSGAPRSVSEVMGVIRTRVERAMASSPASAGSPAPAAPARNYPGSLPQRQPMPFAPPLQAPARGPLPSMAETLRTSFALGSAETNDLPGLAHIRTAYERLGAFGL